jgi:hypothetical protein
MNIVDIWIPWLVGGSVGMALAGAIVVLLLMLLERTALPAAVMHAAHRPAAAVAAARRASRAPRRLPTAAWQSLALLPS